MKRTITCCVCLLCALFVTQAQTTWFVTPGAPVAGTGNSWADARDLQTAINNAAAGDNIFAAQGTYQPASGQSFAMKEGVKIYGGFAGTESSLGQRTISAGHISTLQGNGALVIANPPGLTTASILDGFTITGGAAAYGGGMLNSSASPIIGNCVFTNNSAGCMWNNNSSAVVINCIFSGNYQTSNTVADGGGITIKNGGHTSIINCIFYKNQGIYGGGVSIQNNGSHSIINCTFYGNTTVSPPAKFIWGGIDVSTASGSNIIENCIVWGNGTNASPGYIYTPVTLNNIVQGGYYGDLNVDPLFVNASNGAGADGIWGTADDGLRLQAGSPALNGGALNTTGLNLPATDIAGAVRIQDGKIDMGAYEQAYTCRAATTLYVDSSVTASGDGSSWMAAYKTLGEALIAANQCTNISSIWVAKGTYQPVAGATFSMLPHLAIYGGFPSGGGSFAQRNTIASTSVLQGNGSGRAVVYNANTGLDATAILDGFTITGGVASQGGGMYNSNVSPTINNCVFSGNTASSTNVSGGGMYNGTGASPIVSNCIFSANTAPTSVSSSGGGAIGNQSGAAPTIISCFFYNNTASYGGAFYNHLTTYAVIRNSVFANNTCTKDGGAITNYGNGLIVDNVSFANNSAGRSGGAVDSWQSALSVTNSLFWGNTSGDANTDLWFESGSLNMTYSFTQQSWTGTGNIQGSSSPYKNMANPIGADGLWGTTDDGLVLMAGSSAINSGTPDITGLGLPGTDIAANPRVQGTAIDMGAYESGTLLPIVLISFTGSLRNGIAGLQWQSADELNFKQFEIEKSTDGGRFWFVGEVPAKGSGSTYTYNVPQPEAVAYYRLKMVDVNGSTTISRIIRLTQKVSNELFVYPNPANSHINIQVAAAGKMSLYTYNGVLAKTMTLQAGINTVAIGDLSTGVYRITVNGQQATFIKK